MMTKTTETSFYIKEYDHTRFRPKQVRGQIYPSYAIIDGKTYHTAAGTKSTDFLFGSMLNMYCNGDELLPVPKSTLKADKSFMPEIMTAKAEIKLYLNKTIENMEALWKKFQNPAQNTARLEKNAKEILLATERYMDANMAASNPTQLVLDPITKHVYPVFKIHLTYGSDDKTEFRRDITISNGTETLRLPKQMFDTGAKIPLIMPSIVQQLKLPLVKKVVLSGIGEEQFLTDAVQAKIGIEGNEYESLAAIFPRLRNITNSDVLIDCALYNQTLTDGVDYRITKS